MGTARHINNCVRIGTWMLPISHSNVVLQAMERRSFPARRAVEGGTELDSTKHNTALN